MHQAVRGSGTTHESVLWMLEGLSSAARSRIEEVLEAGVAIRDPDDTKSGD